MRRFADSQTADPKWCAAWANLRGCSLAVNQSDHSKYELISQILPQAPSSAHDGELIAELANSPGLYVILMNPSFAESRERGVDGRTAIRHSRSALRICAAGGRPVAILPDGLDAAAFFEAREQASLLLNIWLPGAFSRSGTGIAVGTVVIEKTAP